jgi:DNA-binding MarR family transcriptional regulator
MAFGEQRTSATLAPDKTPPYDVGFWVSRIQRQIRKQLTDRLEPIGMTLPEYTVLWLLSREPGISGADMARRTLVSPQAINEMITSLERRSLITRSVDPSHGRILQMRLTTAGEQTLRAAYEQVQIVEAGLIEGIDTDDQQKLLELLRNCAGNVGAGLREVP